MKKINKSLLKSIINSDFFLLNNAYCQNSVFLREKLYLKKKSLISLNIIELVKSLKQFIRLFQYIKKTNAFLLINIENQEHSLMIKQFLLDNKLNLNVKIFSSIGLEKPLDKSKTKVFLFLGSFNFISTKQLIENLNVDKIFLFSKINPVLEHNNFGVYRIFNDLLDFKKILFIIILLNQILKD